VLPAIIFCCNKISALKIRNDAFGMNTPICSQYYNEKPGIRICEKITWPASDEAVSSRREFLKEKAGMVFPFYDKM